MGCRTINIPGGFGIVCSRGAVPKCGSCRQYTHTKLCDYPLIGEMQGRTCDMRLCERCAVSVGPNKDYCPAHARVHASEQR